MKEVKENGVESVSVQEMLNEAVEIYSLSDEATIKLSKKRDKEIVEQQRNIYEEWKNKQIGL